MIVHQQHWSAADGWSPAGATDGIRAAGLVLVFGGREALGREGALAELRRRHPGARIVGCSTAGEIAGERVLDDTIVATAVGFEHTVVRAVADSIGAHPGSRPLGRTLARTLAAPDLAHVFVLSDGLEVNGTELVLGFNDVLPESVALTGGLSGDGARFERTLTVLDDEVTGGRVVAVGFYGSRLRVGFGSQGGWDQFGPSRTITRSNGNVLYELDGEPALAVYRKYLGPHAAELPGSALRFPLSLGGDASGEEVVRTILAIDQAENSMTFAGDMPLGAQARLMMANFERLIDGAGAAATASRAGLHEPAELAVLISCVGRKIVLGQRVEEEVEGVRAVLGPDPVLTGFYSYGEISPFSPVSRCRLQNQTMTITTLRES